MRAVFLAAIVLLPTLALAAPHNFEELADLVTNLINGGIGVALILGIVIYFYGIATSMKEISEGGIERVRAHFLWGIIALFVMFSVWGILALLRNTLFGGDTSFGGSNGSGGTLCTSPTDCVIE